MHIVINSWRDLVNPDAGGSELYVDRIASGLQRRGHDVTVVAARPVTDHSYDVMANGGRMTQYLRSPVLYLRRFRNADVVVDVVNGMPFLTPIWRRHGAVVPLVHHVHDVQWRQWFPAPVAAAGRFMEAHAMPAVYRDSLFVTVSESSADSLGALSVDRDRIRIVHNGIDLPASPPQESAEPLFVVLGRLVPHKRVDIALRAWDQVRPVTGGTLVVAGAGPELESLRRIASPDVEFLGHVSDAERERLLARAWLLIHPSMLEGWGLVIMEAAAHSTPTLGFTSPGVKDSVLDGVTGVLTDSAENYADQWIALARDTARRRRMADAGRQRAATFDWDNSADAFEKVMIEAADRAAGRRNR